MANTPNNAPLTFPRTSLASGATALLAAQSMASGSPYYLLQGGVLGVDVGGPATFGLLDGTAAAAGTKVLVVAGAAGQPSAQFRSAAGGDRFDGVRFDQPGGIVIKNIGPNAGTVSATLFGRWVFQ